jgi:hypothetical protein
LAGPNTAVRDAHVFIRRLLDMVERLRYLDIDRAFAGLTGRKRLVSE